MTAIDIHIQSKSYGSLEVLKDIRFQVREGEFVCLFGPSGTGKSTMLNAVAGIDTNFTGDIAIQGDPRLGYVFQEPRLAPWLTVRQNLELVTAEDSALTADIDALLAAVGLTDFADAFPQQLSLGMARRVAIVRAFAVRPGLLLLDEPFVSLDAENSQRLRALLGELWTSRPTTTLFVTHDLREAVELSDRILFFSSRPAQLVREVAVTLPRPRAQYTDELDRLAKELLAG